MEKWENKSLETLLKNLKLLRTRMVASIRHGKELSKTAEKGEIKIGENNLANDAHVRF